VWWHRSVVARLAGSEEDWFFEYLRLGLEGRLGRLGRKFRLVAVGQLRQRGQRFAVLLQRALVLLGETLSGRAHVRAVGFLGRQRRRVLRSRPTTGSPGRKVHDQIGGAASTLHVGGVLLELVPDGGQRLPVDGSLRVGPLPPQLDLVVERVVAQAQALGVRPGPRTVLVAAADAAAVRRLGPVVVFAGRYRWRRRRRVLVRSLPPPFHDRRLLLARGGGPRHVVVQRRLRVQRRVLARVQAVGAAHLQNVTRTRPYPRPLLFESSPQRTVIVFTIIII